MDNPNEIMERFLDEAFAAGFSEARVRDLGYAILNYTLNCPETSYAIAFGNAEPNPREVKKYNKSALQNFLRKRLEVFHAPKTEVAPPPQPTPKSEPVNEEEISFEENKAEIIRSIQRLERMKDEYELDPKTLISVESQILKSRTILKEKFEVTNSNDAQYILVKPKFNHICDITHRECWLQTKEFAMEHWNLVEKEPEV